MAPAERPNFRILLIGKGGREHALAWKLTCSKYVEHVYIVPGNAGTEALPKASNCCEVAENDYPGLVKLSRRLNINLVVVGPDDAIVAGIGDYFRYSKSPGILTATFNVTYFLDGISCFAPSERAAAIEGSKHYAKDFMARMSIPTAAYKIFDKQNYEEAKAYLKNLNRRVVIKADGLAAGKGVVLPETQEEAQQALQEIMLDGKFGPAGETVIVEEYLEGYEMSILTFTDGTSILSLPPGQDHKRARDGNKGLNTGGMGVFAPIPFVSSDSMTEIEQTIIMPTIRGLEIAGESIDIISCA